MDDGPVAAAAEPGLAGPELDAACHAVLGLPPDAAVAVPAWWDANAPARRVTYVRARVVPPPPAALAGAARSRLLRRARARARAAARSGRGPRSTARGRRRAPPRRRPADLRSGRDGHRGRRPPRPRRAAAPAAHGPPRGREHGRLGRWRPRARRPRPCCRACSRPTRTSCPGSAREVAARLAAIAAAVPDTTPAAEAAPANPRRRRARLATALVLLAVAGGAGALVLTQRVGPPGPALSPGTVTVPEPPAVTP